MHPPGSRRQAEDMQTLKDEFDRMVLAAGELKLAKSNPALTREIAPWITAFGLWAQMGQEALALAEVAKAQEHEQSVRILKRMHVLQRLIEQNDRSTAAGAASLGTAVIQPLIKHIMETKF